MNHGQQERCKQTKTTKQIQQVPLIKEVMDWYSRIQQSVWKQLALDTQSWQ